MARYALPAAVAVIASLAVCFTWSACAGRQQPSGVAVVDLDEVARRLGRADEMNQTFQSSTGKVQQQLAEVQQRAVEQLKDMKKQLGDHPSQEETLKFNRITQQANLQFNQLKQQAETQLSRQRQQLVAQFRDDAKPVAARLAKEKGFGTVVTKNDQIVFAFDEAVDITDEVVKLMSANAPARPATPAAQPEAPSAAPAGDSGVQQTAYEQPAATN